MAEEDTQPTPQVEPIQEEQHQQGSVSENSRTQEQFEKLTDSNKELKSEVEQLKEETRKYQSVLDSLYPAQQPQVPQAKEFTNLNQTDIDTVFAQMQDANGYIDGSKLINALKDMDKKARDAESRAQRVEEHLQRVETANTQSKKTAVTKEVHTKYPELDPENVDIFNADLWEMVRNEMIGQAMEGKEDFMGAASKWYSKFYKENDVTKAEKQEKEQKEVQKQQINAVKATPAPKQTSAEDNAALIMRVRQGKKGALAELLRQRGQ